jgi:hypothetical protein
MCGGLTVLILSGAVRKLYFGVENEQISET